MNPVQQQAKQPLHTRTITCAAYARDDNLVDIEGTLRDIKHQQFSLPERGVVMPGEPLHEMKLLITIDSNFVIRDAKATTLHSPYRICGAITDSYRQIIGLRIESGFTRQIKQMFRGISGCSHLTELLPPMATTALQVMLAASMEKRRNNPDGASDHRTTPLGPTPLGGCHALREDGEVVKQFYPQHYLEGNIRSSS